ncbi:hypothetical protein BKA66DRAFT_454387 [Pyrenochaeta sp. MPI-SDFR-AT-0127]|nr:hypothetical protein BKA66DRAFT_454387 [Pyrenochaeta sp. MPI-SDFR-AT-0127]
MEPVPGCNIPVTPHCAGCGFLGNSLLTEETLLKRKPALTIVKTKNPVCGFTPKIMSKLEIHVTGTGHVIHRAERGILVLQAQTQQVNTAEEASEIVTATANELRAAISPHCPQDEATGRTKDDAAISHYTMTTLDTSNHHNTRRVDGKDEWYYTYSARAEFHVKFADFNVLDELATQFSAMANVRIQRITWHLTDTTLDSIKGDARKKAAQDALQRARDYAEVFGGFTAQEAVSKVKAVEVREGNRYQEGTRPQLHSGKMQRPQESRRKKEELRFESEDVRLQVEVSGKFVVEV